MACWRIVNRSSSVPGKNPPSLGGRTVKITGTAVSYTWIYFVYVPEAYPTQIRSIAFGVGSTCLRIGGMITPYIAQVMMENSEKLALGVYILMGIVGTIAPLLLPTETKGIDLSSPESYRLLDDHSPS